MQTAHFSLGGLDQQNQSTPTWVPDLGTLLTGISGVGQVGLDVRTRTVVIEYDPQYVSAQALERMITGAGYPNNEVGGGG